MVGGGKLFETIYRITGNKIDEIQMEELIQKSIFVGRSDSGRVVEALSGVTPLRIVSLLRKNYMTIEKISGLLSIPKVTCYKQVSRLKCAGVISKGPSIRTSTHGISSSYTSALESYSVTVSNEQVEATINWKDGTKDVFAFD